MITDSSRKKVWEADYMPFGEEIVSTENIENNRKFIGKEEDCTTPTASYTYANANTYTVKVRVTDNGGLKAENSVTITVTSATGSSLKGNLDTTYPGSANRVDGHDLYILSKAFGSNSQSQNSLPAHGS